MRDVARELLLCMLRRTYLSDSEIILLFTLGALCYNLVCYDFLWSRICLRNSSFRTQTDFILSET